MANFDFMVTSENGSGTGDLTGLNNVISAIDQGGADAGVGNTYTITLGGNFTLTRDMLALNLDTGAALTVVGGGHTIDGGHTSGGTGHRAFFVFGGDVTLENLTVAHAHAQGGAGGTGQTGGGGGAGLGGGLFVAGTNVVNGTTLSGGTVTLSGVSFTGNVAYGGNGGNGGGVNSYVTNSYSGGGGGGMGGNGGNGGIDSRGYSPNGGGGGLGAGATGGSAASFVTKYGGTQTGKGGIVPGAIAGGAGGGGAAGGAGGGGGGASGPGTIGHPMGPGGGGGGVGGGDGTVAAYGWGGAGGAGGFGGGGGGTYAGGGQGGFGGGGGGGGGTFGGAGGFGGGGGGNNLGGSNGGFGGGYGGTGGSGGAGTAGGGAGLGAGGAIFVQEGGQLIIGAGGISGGKVLPGQPGNDLGGKAHAFGAGMFIQGHQNVTLAPDAGQTLTIADVIADMDGSPVLYRPSSGAGIIAVAGAGTVKLTAADTYTGGTMLGGSATLELGAASAAGSGAIDFASGTARLVIDGGVILANTIGLLQTGDVIDAAGFQGGSAAFDPGARTLTFSQGTASLALTLDAAYAPASFVSAIDTAGTGLAVTFTACYAAGARVLSARGEVPIEALRVGEPVVCASGRLVPVRWLGRRRVDFAAGTPGEAWPVRVRKGAGAGMPARDLVLSPDHAVHVEGVLVPVRYLVNGRTVVQEPVATIQYWHLELPAHDVVVVEGLTAESYLDTGNRMAFEACKAAARAVG